MSGRKHKRKRLPSMDEHLDLVPLIDCVFLLLLFFMLCGRLASDQRTEQITVPPTKTAMKFDSKQWDRVVINVYGSTQKAGSKKTPRNAIQLPPKPFWFSEGDNNLLGYQNLRQALNGVYDKAAKYPDPKNTGIMLPKVICEIRADADTEYRVVQEVQQVLSDTIDPFNNMLPRAVDPKTLKAFVNVDFTTRKPTDKTG